MLKVMREQCAQCLFSSNKIVSDSRRAEILKECRAEQQFFVCHKPAVLEAEGKYTGDTNVCCNGFYEKMGEVSQLVRIAERLNAVEFVELPTDDESGQS